MNFLYTPTMKEWRSRYPSLDHLRDRAQFGFFPYGIFPNTADWSLPSRTTCCGYRPSLIIPKDVQLLRYDLNFFK